MFQLLNYSHKLEKLESTNTQTTFKCPCCGGKLKLNLKTKAYKCFTSACLPADIRSRLGATAPSGGAYTPVPKSIFVRPIEEKIAAPLFSTTSYVAPKVRVCSDRIITSYYYSSDRIIERVDFLDKNIKKQVFPKFRVGGVWTYGRADFGLLNAQYIDDSPGVVLVGEGEKVADTVTRVTGYVCLTPSMCSWAEADIARELRKHNNIEAVIFLPDNDEAGRAKTGIMRRACWSIGIPCSVFDYGIEMSDGGDIVDLYDQGYDIASLIYDKYYSKRTVL